jgi:quinol monooxygenase YgiN
LKQYRDTSRKEEGNVGIEVFEQIGRPGHFVIVEMWADQKALDAHELTSHTTRLHSTLEPVRVSDYDERPYNMLTIASAGAVMNPQAIYVIAHVDTTNPNTAQELLQHLATESRKDPGCLRFDVLQHATHNNHFTVIEAWHGGKALEDHVQTSHAREYRDSLHAISGGPLDERFYKLVS